MHFHLFFAVLSIFLIFRILKSKSFLFHVHPPSSFSSLPPNKNLHHTASSTSLRIYLYPEPLIRQDLSTFHMHILPLPDHLDIFSLYNNNNDKAILNYPHLFSTNEQVAVMLSTFYSQMNPLLVTTPSMDTVRTLTNRMTFQTYLQANGFKINRPIMYRNFSRIGRFPVVIQPVLRQEEGGVNVVFSRSQLIKNAKRFAAQNRKFIVQEWILNRMQYIVHFTAWKGRLLRFTCFEEDLEDVMGMHAVQSQLQPNYVCHEELFVGLVRQLNFTGFGHAKVKMKLELGEEVPKILTMNPWISAALLENPTLLADYICSLQQEGRSTLSPVDGCQEVERLM